MPRFMFLLALFALAGCARAAPAPPPTDPPGSAVAVFAGGCFWCTEADFDKMPGVIKTVSGFTGGHVANPSYEQVTRGDTGHIEAVRVTYDPARISYRELADRFYRTVDPLDAGGQFCDRGYQYRTAIFVTPEQRAAAEEATEAVRSVLKRPVATLLLSAGPFYPAEAYHQDYYQKNPIRYRYYRARCGRDARLADVWGEQRKAK
jgi:peptide-methionine (S)-S-oxide reductase